MHGTGADFGLLLGCFGVGSIGGAFASSPLRRRFGSETVVGLGTLCSAAGLFGLAMSPSAAAMMPLALVGGAGWTSCLTSLQVAMQMRAPQELLGRAMSIYQAFTIGLAAIGAWGWGLLSDLTSLRTALCGSAAALLASTLVLRVLSPLPARGEGVVVGRG